MTAPAKPDRALTARRLSVDAFCGMAEAFADLSARAAEANPHMSPAAVQAAARTLLDPAAIVILAAVLPEGRLAGIWALSRYRGVETGGVTVLRTPLVPLYEVLSAPVLDKDHGDAALASMMSLLRASPDLPKCILARTFPVEGAGFAALTASPATRLHVIERWSRGVMLPRAGEAPEEAIRRALGASAKKRRNQRRALERLGDIAVEQADGEAALAAFETFVTLEDAGWKGRDGTSLRRSGTDLSWWRELVAASDGVRITTLRQNGTPLACGVTLTQGGVALFLKTAFNEAFAKFSPGLHLEIEITRAALARSDLRRFDCGGDASVDADAHIWAERRAMGHVLIDLGGGPMSCLPLLALRAKAGLRAIRNRWRG